MPMVQPGCQFASDNTSGICPEAWDAMNLANSGYAKPYGEDEWTTRVADKLRELFEADLEMYMAFNGTAANSMALSAMCQSYHSVICSDVAHVETDECGGPEFFSHGIKLLLANAPQGKMSPESVEEIVRRRTDIHFPKPHVFSLTQTTELGTVYTIDELQLLTGKAKELGLRVHMDGARLFTAVASLGVSLKEVTHQVGVDVLCLGGTKNGLPVGDIVVFFNREIASEFDYRCKQAGQLASKMRYLSAPWHGLLESGAWRKHAEHAIGCAKMLAEKLSVIDGVELLVPCEANAVFVALPLAWQEKLRNEGWYFYNFIGQGGARLMCSWKTTDEEIDALVDAVRNCA